MKKFIIISLALGALSFTACSNFEDINKDPYAVDESVVPIEYLINRSITEAQQNPDCSERIFVLNWHGASRQFSPNANSSISFGRFNEGWINNFYDYTAQWQSSINLAIDKANHVLASGVTGEKKAQVEGQLGVAKVWRVYLMSEFVDTFGNQPIDGFQGKNPSYVSCKDDYYFMLKELTEAAALLKGNKSNYSDDTKKCDRVYHFDLEKWEKYANSMRMRLAMRLSEADPAKAKAEFEAAVKEPYISVNEDNMTVAERPGWDALTGVMTREWSDFPISATLNNLVVNLGGIKTVDYFSDASAKRQAAIKKQIKDEDYMGVQYNNHYTLETDDPAKGFWFDGLHSTMDPRMYALFSIPGDFENGDYCKYPSWAPDAYKQTTRKLLSGTTVKDEKGNDVEGSVAELNSEYTWNAAACGNWGKKGQLNKIFGWPYAEPNMKLSYRNSQNSRIFFPSWESFFLIAEASVRGWNVPISGKEAYETGIRRNFAYFKVEKFADAYLNSEAYNNVGTSVKWDHTAEPPATKTMKAIDGYTKQQITYTYKYPVAANTLYGKALNDHLTKIITQKYIAETPWLPLEAWNDQRRLGLPFFETPAVEEPILTLPAINKNNYSKQVKGFYAQRLPFPTNIKLHNPEGYKQAVENLGGPDDVFTPIWWAKK